ncbi:signal peptidase I [Eubacteriales bacterium OttesenSCG-928-K08]|nr:signal peptidase I [Eubacteriales bacterium OttesenSCG-928-K08]
MSKNISRREAAGLKRAAEEIHSHDVDYQRAVNYEFYVLLVLVILVAFAIRSFIGEPIRVDGVSMYPTLKNDERMIVEKLTYYVKEPKRGDIIVCYYPGYKESCVKRVIGVPGDTVAIYDGKIYINSQLADESEYWDDVIYGGVEPTLVPDKHVYVMGDNRNHSTDSRDPSVGAIPYEKILGRAVCIMWPLSEIRPLT